MSEREPNEKDLDQATEDVEGHGIEDDDAAGAADAPNVLDVNFACA